MDPHEPFLKAILASRHDDLPRLVYADWLEESGEPANVARAHFIRTQIHLESADPKSDLFHEMKALEARILEWYLDDWRYELPEFVRYGSDVERVKWRRGFPDDLGPMTGHQYLNEGRAALLRMPVTCVQLLNRQFIAGFHHLPEFAEIAHLKLGPRFPLVRDEFDPPDALASLTTASVFTSLRSLDLSENTLTDDCILRFATSFAAASFSRTLVTLDLSGNFGITDAGANVLATAPGLDGLKVLRLHDTGITSFGTMMLRKRFGKRLA